MYVGHMFLQGILFQGQDYLGIEHGSWDDFWGHLGMGIGGRALLGGMWYNNFCLYGLQMKFPRNIK